MAEGGIGQVLTGRGWAQGSLLPTIGHAYFERNAVGAWQVRTEETPDQGERWIVISQGCDIEAPTEPFVEAMSCTWHPKGSREYSGASRGNSARYFLVRREEDSDGGEGALIANATRVIQVTKTSLMELPLEYPVAPDEQRAFSRRFGAWLGGRYSRPALEQSVVDEIQRPIVEALGGLKPGDPACEARAIIREVRMYPVEAPGQDLVDLLLLIEDGIAPDDERIAAFAGTLEEALVSTSGETRLQSCLSLTAGEMLVSEYENTIKVPLDHYTQRGEEIHGAEPVRGIEHG